MIDDYSTFFFKFKIRHNLMHNQVSSSNHAENVCDIRKPRSLLLLACAVSPQVNQYKMRFTLARPRATEGAALPGGHSQCSVLRARASDWHFWHLRLPFGRKFRTFCVGENARCTHTHIYVAR